MLHLYFSWLFFSLLLHVNFLADESNNYYCNTSLVKCTRTHVYFCMKNSPLTEDEFHSSLLNVADHYQGNHDKCHAESPCKSEGYVMSKKPLTKPAAIAAYKKAIMGTTIYRHCSDYMRVTICCFILFLTNFIHCIISMFTVVQWS